MTNRLILLAAFICLIFTLSLNGHNLSGKERMKPIDLKTDYLINPIGIDNPNPRLMWKIEDGRIGAKQTAYRLIVGTDSISISSKASLDYNRLMPKNETSDNIFWDTRKIESDSQHILYKGQALKPFTKYFWKVIIWDFEQSENSSDIQSFETGMMNINSWQGNWICDGKDINYEAAPYFRKKFVANKDIASARIYIAVAGLYELYVNGKKIGDQRLNPIYTRFDRRNLYVTHDITAELKTGENVMGVVLGNGWYNHQSIAVWDFHQAPWRNRPTFCLDLHISYEDGSTDIVGSDLSWKKFDSPIIFNSIYTAEHYDARLEEDGWSRPEFDDSHWHGVKLRSAPSQNITSQQLSPIKSVLTLPAVSFRKIDNFSYLFDFGQNMSGTTKIKVTGNRGTKIEIKHGERLNNDGRIDLSNIDVYYRGDNEKEPFQTDVLFLSGEGEEEFMARFNYKGFRYAEVTSSEPITLNSNSLTAYFIHSDVTSIGKIESSSQLINRIWKATNNAYLSNLMGYPTDCPQREKNGWTGDGHFAIETALYNFDGITIYEKWLADHRDEQQPNGVLPDIIPTGGWGYGTANGLDWTSTVAIIPWEIYRFYGDSKLLADCYYNIKSYVDYVDRTSPEGLTSWGRGDWVPVKSHSNLELTSSVYFYVDAQILANAAELFGKEDDYRYYSALATKIKDAINKKFLNRETAIYANGTQAELSVPLHWKIVPDDMIDKVAENLAKKVKEADFHLDVGVLGAKAILNALSENGYPDIAYKVAVQESYPSWGWWIVNGATTLLENWDLNAERDISDNHMMFGEIGAWFFKGLGGIFPDPQQPGFKHIILRPHFERSLEFINVQFNSPYGLIESKWRWENERLIYDIVIPANSTATLYLPDSVIGNKHLTFKAGSYSLNLQIKPEK